jgi:hypothetical protein
MIGLFEAAWQIQSFCDRQDWRSCFIGGIAVQRWGEPRVTLDVDVTVLTGFGGEDVFIDTLLARFPGRLANAREFAQQRRVLLLKTPEGVGIDISLGALPFEDLVVRRATPFSFAPGLDLRTCSAEDLIVLKLFALRPLDVRDAETVALRQKDHLDWRYVEEQLRPLAEMKEDPRIFQTLASLRILAG